MSNRLESSALFFKAAIAPETEISYYMTNDLFTGDNENHWSRHIRSIEHYHQCHDAGVSALFSQLHKYVIFVFYISAFL